MAQTTIVSTDLPITRPLPPSTLPQSAPANRLSCSFQDQLQELLAFQDHLQDNYPLLHEQPESTQPQYPYPFQPYAIHPDSIQSFPPCTTTPAQNGSTQIFHSPLASLDNADDAQLQQIQLHQPKCCAHNERESCEMPIDLTPNSHQHAHQPLEPPSGMLHQHHRCSRRETTPPLNPPATITPPLIAFVRQHSRLAEQTNLPRRVQQLQQQILPQKRHLDFAERPRKLQRLGIRASEERPYSQDEPLRDDEQHALLPTPPSPPGIIIPIYGSPASFSFPLSRPQSPAFSSPLVPSSPLPMPEGSDENDDAMAMIMGSSGGSGGLISGDTRGWYRSSSFLLKMMGRMGFQWGRGLGKDLQGLPELPEWDRQFKAANTKGLGFASSKKRKKRQRQRQTTENFLCSICQTTLSGQQQKQQHIQGKRHQKKLRRHMLILQMKAAGAEMLAKQEDNSNTNNMSTASLQEEKGEPPTVALEPTPTATVSCDNNTNGSYGQVFDENYEAFSLGNSYPAAATVLATPFSATPILRLEEFEHPDTTLTATTPIFTLPTPSMVLAERAANTTTTATTTTTTTTHTTPTTEPQKDTSSIWNDGNIGVLIDGPDIPNPSISPAGALSTSETAVRGENYCEVCQKSFSGPNQKLQHESGRRHRNAVSALGGVRSNKRKAHQMDNEESELDPQPPWPSGDNSTTTTTITTTTEQPQQQQQLLLQPHPLSPLLLSSYYGDTNGYLLPVDSPTTTTSSTSTNTTTPATPGIDVLPASSVMNVDVRVEGGEEEAATYGPATSTDASFCTVCKKFFSSPTQLTQHETGKKHKKKLAAASTEAKKVSFICEICNRAFSGPSQLSRHLTGKKHQKRLALLQR